MFVEGKKMGTFFNGTYHWTGGDEPNFGDNGGQVVYSDGVQQTMLDAEMFEPVTGLDFDLETAMLNKQNVNITLGVINGNLHQLRMRILEVSHDGVIKSGMLNGKFKLGGSAPVITPA
jgi:phospholipase C